MTHRDDQVNQINIMKETTHETSKSPFYSYTRVTLLMLQVMPLTAFCQLAQTMTFEMSSENK